MKASKKFIAALLCGALTLTAAGCGNTTGTALTIDGQEIRAGIYIYYQLSALNDASVILGEEQPDLDMYAEDFDITTQTVEGVNVEEWVKNKTIESCKRYVAVEKAFEEYGLSLTKEETDTINAHVTSIWEDENMYAQYIYGVDVIGEYYENLGIGEKSYKDVTTSGYKEEMIFDYLYGEGGTNAVPPDELDNQVKTKYALVSSFTIDPEVKSPNEYLEMLNGGTSFIDVHTAYTKDESLKEIEEAMAEATENGEEYTGVLPENLEVAAVELSTLQQVVENGTEYPSASYVTDVFNMANGENKVITSSVTSSSGTTSVTYYLVNRVDITTDAEKMEEYRDKALNDLKGDEFDATLKTKGEAYSVTENAAAIKKYTVKNLER